MSLLDNLVSYWKLDEASGTRVDVHGSNNLTDVNTVTQAAGKIGNAGQFVNANDEYLEIAVASQSGLDFTGSLTVSAWVWMDTTGFRYILSKGGTATGGGYVLEWTTSGSRFRFSISDGSVVRLVNGLSTTATGQWFFIVAWYNSGDNSVNIQVDNGTPETATPAGGAPTANAVSFKIGWLQGSTAHWDGRIDEVAVWGRVLTSPERTNLYNSGAGLAYTDFLEPITGDLAATEAPDTAALSGSVLIEGDLVATEATDAVSMSGDVRVQGTLAATEAQDVAAFVAIHLYAPVAHPGDRFHTRIRGSRGSSIVRVVGG
jgi:hypothetical protein